MAPGFNPVDFAVPGFILLVLIEMVWARRKSPDAYEPRDTLTSLAMGLGSSVAGLLTAGSVGAVFLWLYQFRLFDIPWTWWAWALCFVLDDLAYYVFHRTAHRVRWFWASHVNHHSSQHHNLSTALRQTWTGTIAFGFIFRLPAADRLSPGDDFLLRGAQPDLPVLVSYRGDQAMSALV